MIEREEIPFGGLHPTIVYHVRCDTCGTTLGVWGSASPAWGYDRWPIESVREIAAQRFTMSLSNNGWSWRAADVPADASWNTYGTRYASHGDNVRCRWCAEHWTHGDECWWCREHPRRG